MGCCSSNEQKESILQTLDRQLGEYYAARNRDDYFDENGNGKLLVHFEQKGITGDSTLSLARDARFYRPLTEEFPIFSICLEHDVDEQIERENQFLFLMKHFRRHEALPSDAEMADNYPSISWQHIAQCVKHEMYPLLGTKIASVDCLSLYMHDLSEGAVTAVTTALKNKVSTREVQYIKEVVQRAKEFKISKKTYKNS